jgi:hypothetical protein
MATICSRSHVQDRMADSDKTDIHSVKVLGEGAFGIVDLVVSAARQICCLSEA